MGRLPLALGVLLPIFTIAIGCAPAPKDDAVRTPAGEESAKPAPPWIVSGTVTDAAGRPLEGVKVEAHLQIPVYSGWTGPRPAAAMRTGPDGSYTLSVHPVRTPALTNPVEGGPAFLHRLYVYAKHDEYQTGLGEASPLWMASRKPRAGEFAARLAPEHILLRGQPGRCDFILIARRPSARSGSPEEVLPPPVDAKLQAEGRRVLREMARANRHWLGPLPPLEDRVDQFETPCTVSITYVEPRDARRRTRMPRIRAQGMGRLGDLTEVAEEAVFHDVDLGEDMIRLGYGRTTLWIDARTLTPRRWNERDEVTFFDEFVRAADGSYAPRVIWTADLVPRESRFRFYEPGLWLPTEFRRFDLSDPSGGYRTTHYVTDVQVNGQPAQEILAEPNS